MKGATKTGAFVNQLRKELNALAEEEKNNLFALSVTSDEELKTKYKNQIAFVDTIKIDVDELIDSMAKDWHIK